MTVEVLRRGIDRARQLDFTQEPVGEMEPGGRDMGIIHYRLDGKQSGYVLAHDDHEARIYRLTPGTFRVVWSGGGMLQLLTDPRATTDFPMRLFATLSSDARERCVMVREQDGQKAFYTFKFK